MTTIAAAIDNLTDLDCFQLLGHLNEIHDQAQDRKQLGVALSTNRLLELILNRQQRATGKVVIPVDPTRYIDTATSMSEADKEQWLIHWVRLTELFSNQANEPLVRLAVAIAEPHLPKDKP